MDFELTEEQKMLQQAVRDFVAKECPREYARKIDEAEEFPTELFNKMAALGWHGLSVPVEYGGLGGDTIDTTIVVEELSRAAVAVGITYFLSMTFGAKTLTAMGNEEQKKEYLTKLARGNLMFCFAITEPAGGTDILGALSTFAALDGDDFIVNGNKIYTTAAHVSDYIITVVKTDKNPPKKTLGISILLIPSKSPGVDIRRVKKLGVKAVGTNEIFFTDVKVPKANLLGKLDKGWYSIVDSLNDERIAIAALCLGVAQAALDDAVNYAKDRKAFGKPIGQFQSLQHRLAEAAAEIEMARLMTYKAAWLASRGKDCAVESAVAKWFAAETLFRTVTTGMRVLGGVGFMMDYDMQRYFRDSAPFLFAPISNEMCLNFIGEHYLGLPRSY